MLVFSTHYLIPTQSVSVREAISSCSFHTHFLININNYMSFEDADKLINHTVRSLSYSVLLVEMKDGLVYYQLTQAVNESVLAISTCPLRRQSI